MQLEYRTFRNDAPGVVDNPGFQAWWQAVHLGFHQGIAETETVEWSLKQSVADDWLIRGVWDTDLPPEALDPLIPVATFLSWEKTLNVGEGKLLPVHLISQVTVRPTHRRRGILRRMMSDDLTAAKEKGFPMAALTATEATIYGRFGFGAAAFTNEITVGTDGFKLRTEPAGTVQVTSRHQMAELAPDVFDRWHRQTLGSVDRQHFYAEERAGLFDMYRQEENDKVRCALHYDDGGKIDGFVCYVLQPPKDRMRSIRVLDLCALTPDAYLGLWDFLGAVDLVSQVHWDMAPSDDPLRWALVDQRAHRVDALKDRLWLRVLDPVAALEGRGYATDGEITVTIADPMGFADGTYHLKVENRRGTVTPVDGPGEVVIGVEEFGSMYLGGVGPGVLLHAGRLQADSHARAMLRRLLGGFGHPWCNTDF